MLNHAVAIVGNTHVRVVRFQGDKLQGDGRVASAEAIATPPALDGLPVGLVSVVPAVAQALTRAWEAAGSLVTPISAANAGMASRYEPPDAMGADRVANAKALWACYGAGVAIDAGTATTLTFVDREGVIQGGAILPGLTTARNSLATGTALLPAVPLAPSEDVIGRSTLASLQIGLVEGHVGAIQHLVARMRSADPTATAMVITGGWGEMLAPLLGVDHDPLLTVKGAKLIHQRLHG